MEIIIIFYYTYADILADRYADFKKKLQCEILSEFLLFYKLYINLNMFSFSGEDIEEEPQEELTAEQRQGQNYRLPN